MSNVYANIPSSFGEATAKLRGRDDMSLGYETRLWTDGHAIYLRHHATNIVTYHSDDSFTVTTGGWFSVTTKRRIDAALSPSMGLGTDKGVWYICGRRGDNWNRVEFEDGDRIRWTGSDFEVK